MVYPCRPKSSMAASDQSGYSGGGIVDAFSRLVAANVVALADVGIGGFCGNVYRAVNGPEQHAQTAGMVSVFMRDQYSIESLNVFANERKSTRDLLCAEPGINENPSLAGNDQNRIAS